MNKKRKNMIEINAWYDGACEPKNPGGHGGGGWIIKMENTVLASGSLYLPAAPNVSNNVAEYTGLICVLEWLVENKMMKEKIIVHGDNMMSVMQMAGRWRAKKGFYVPLFKKAKNIARNFKRIKFKWIPREENSEADELSKQALVDNGVIFRIQPRD